MALWDKNIISSSASHQLSGSATLCSPDSCPLLGAQRSMCVFNYIVMKLVVVSGHPPIHLQFGSFSYRCVRWSLASQDSRLKPLPWDHCQLWQESPSCTPGRLCSTTSWYEWSQSYCVSSHLIPIWNRFSFFRWKYTSSPGSWFNFLCAGEHLSQSSKHNSKLKTGLYFENA